MEQVPEVGGGLEMEGFVGKEEDLEMDALWEREPVEVLQDRGDVVMGAGEETCGGVWMVYHRGCISNSLFWIK